MRRKTLVILILAAALILAAVFGIAVFRNKDTRTYDEKVAAFAQENPTFEQGQIVFIGDSITARYSLPDYYRNLDLQVYNRGISGDTTDWMLTRLQISLLDLAPSKIVLMIGTNDINYGKGAKEIAQSYESLLTLIASELPDTEVFCVSIIPQNKRFSKDAQKNNACIQETNQEIERLADSYGYTYVPLYGKLTDKNGFLKRSCSPDGLHLGAIGYKIWTDVMQEYLQ